MSDDPVNSIRAGLTHTGYGKFLSRDGLVTLYIEAGIADLFMEQGCLPEHYTQAAKTISAVANADRELPLTLMLHGAHTEPMLEELRACGKFNITEQPRVFTVGNAGANTGRAAAKTTAYTIEVKK